LTRYQARHFAQRISDGLFQPFLFRSRGAAQYMIQHIAAIAGMTNAQPQPGEIVAAQLGNQIAQSIVAAVTAAPLQAHGAWRQIQIVVNDQDFR
jgi:hypothetical protein